jgi:hypothetical protein
MGSGIQNVWQLLAWDDQHEQYRNKTKTENFRTLMPCCNNILQKTQTKKGFQILKFNLKGNWLREKCIHHLRSSVVLRAVDTQGLCNYVASVRSFLSLRMLTKRFGMLVMSSLTSFMDSMSVWSDCGVCVVLFQDHWSPHWSGISCLAVWFIHAHPQVQ